MEQRLAREVTDAHLDMLGGRVLLTLHTGELRITDIAQTLFAAVPDVSRKLGPLGRGIGGVQPFRRPVGARNIRHTE